jgi:tripartite-type tricarboxylate transporter receptor subunit TctC
VVPFAPGGGNDIIARIIGGRLADAFGQSVVIENRPGAGGVIGTDLVAKALPDGYTLMIGATSTLAANPSLYTKMNLDPTRDLTPITQIASGPFVLAVPSSLPARSVPSSCAGPVGDHRCGAACARRIADYRGEREAG